jgi:hypothetical protein
MAIFCTYNDPTEPLTALVRFPALPAGNPLSNERLVVFRRCNTETT